MKRFAYCADMTITIVAAFFFISGWNTKPC